MAADADGLRVSERRRQHDHRCVVQPVLAGLAGEDPRDCLAVQESLYVDRRPQRPIEQEDELRCVALNQLRRAVVGLDAEGFRVEGSQRYLRYECARRTPDESGRSSAISGTNSGSGLPGSGKSRSLRWAMRRIANCAWTRG